MHLTYEQSNLFFDVMDSLLLYANDRFHVVEDFQIDDDDPMLELKTSLVTSFLWDNLPVIDEFVSSSELDARSRAIALSWRYPLRDTFTLIRYQDGSAIMMNDEHVFKVNGIVDDLDDTTGRVPAYVRAVLLPFEDVIVYDGFLSMSDVPVHAERNIQDRFESLCSKSGIVTSGSDLLALSKQLLQRQQDHDIQSLFESLSKDGAGDSQTLPDGFHRGVLAGRSEAQRDASIKSYFHNLDVQSALVSLSQRACNHEPVYSLEECLAMFPKERLYEACESLQIKDYRSKSLQQLCNDIAQALLAYPDDIQDALLWAEDGQFQMIEAYAEHGSFTFSDSQAAVHLNVWPLLPYVYLFHSSGTFTLVVPNEVLPFIKSIDFKQFAVQREQAKRALFCAVACVVSCGIVSLDDVYRQYVRYVEKPLSQEAYLGLISNEASYGDLSFEIMDLHGINYLVHYTICDDYVAQQVVQQGSNDAFSQLGQNGRIDQNLYQSMLSDLRRGIGREMDNAQSVRDSLIETHKQLSMKPIDPVMIERDAYEVLCEYESVRLLRSFLDAHVPDGADDYTFADHAVQEIVATCVEVGDRQALLSYVKEIGLDGCTNDHDRFERLLIRVFDDMPSWENNGWSDREITERLTGRHVFYDADGNPMRIGENDPCPCGSGKKYGDCHGRRS